MIEMLYDHITLKKFDPKVCPIYWSVFKHQFSITKKLIERGIDCNIKNKN